MKRILFFLTAVLPLTSIFGQADTSGIVETKAQLDTIVAIEELDLSDTLDNYDPRSIIIKIVSGNTKVHKTFKPCVSSNISSTEDLLEDYLKYWFKSFLDAKIKKKKGSLVIEEVNVVDIGSGILNIYINTDVREKIVKIDLAFEVNNSYFIDSAATPELFQNSKKFTHKLIKGYYEDYYGNILNQLQTQLDNLIADRQSRVYHKQQLQNTILKLKDKILSDNTSKLNITQSIRKSRSKISKHSELVRVHNLELEEQKAELEKFENEKSSGKITDEDYYLKEKRSKEKQILKTNNVITKSEKIKLKTEQKIVTSETRILQLEADIEENNKQIKTTEELLLSAEKEIEESNQLVDKKELQISKIKEQIELIY